MQSDILKTYRHNLSAKTERIITGIYLVSSLIQDDEPLKWHLRKKALKTLDLSHKGLENELSDVCEDLLGLISLGQRSALISAMNADLLSQGIEALAKTLLGTPLVKQSFLELPQQQQSPQYSLEENKDIPTKDISKGQNKPVLNKGQKVVKKTSNRKYKRRESVLDALAKKKESSIKDIARQVRGCSEKTIQRELNALITEGIVLKKGERRWSVYMLA